MSRNALLVVDFQNDFCPGGALGVPNGDQVVAPINKLISHIDLATWTVLFSRDWHPEHTEHFGKWPPHCIQGTPGAEFHPGLLRPLGSKIISKGYGARDDGYSLFDGVYVRKSDWPLSPEVLLHGCERVLLCGLATDFCVKATALDAVKKGFETVLIVDACRGVNLHPGDDLKAIREMFDAGVTISSTGNILR